MARKRRTAAMDGSTDSVLEATTVEAGFETAFAVALGDDLSAPARDDAPIRWTLNAGNDTPLTAGVCLADKVDGPPALTRRLRQIAVIAPQDGPRLAAHLSAGQRLVTREGALWRWDGYCRDAGAPSAAAERLSQKNRLAVLERELTALVPEREAAEASAVSARDSLRQAVAAETEARQGASAARATPPAATRAAVSRLV